MAALAVEDVCFALTADAASPEEMVLLAELEIDRHVISAGDLAFCSA